MYNNKDGLLSSYVFLLYESSFLCFFLNCHNFFSQSIYRYCNYFQHFVIINYQPGPSTPPLGFGERWFLGAHTGACANVCTAGRGGGQASGFRRFSGRPCRWASVSPSVEWGARGQGADKLGRPGMWSLCPVLGHL